MEPWLGVPATHHKTIYDAKTGRVKMRIYYKSEYDPVKDSEVVKESLMSWLSWLVSMFFRKRKAPDRRKTKVPPVDCERKIGLRQALALEPWG